MANKLSLNIEKTIFIHFGPKNTKLVNNLQFGKNIIERKDNTKFLGIWIDNIFKTRVHMLTTSKKKLQIVLLP